MSIFLQIKNTFRVFRNSLLFVALFIAPTISFSQGPDDLETSGVNPYPTDDLMLDLILNDPRIRARLDAESIKRKMDQLVTSSSNREQDARRIAKIWITTDITNGLLKTDFYAKDSNWARVMAPTHGTRTTYRLLGDTQFMSQTLRDLDVVDNQRVSEYLNFFRRLSFQFQIDHFGWKDFLTFHPNDFSLEGQDVEFHPDVQDAILQFFTESVSTDKDLPEELDEALNSTFENFAAKSNFVFGVTAEKMIRDVTSGRLWSTDFCEMLVRINLHATAQFEATANLPVNLSPDSTQALLALKVLMTKVMPDGFDEWMKGLTEPQKNSARYNFAQLILSFEEVVLRPNQLILSLQDSVPSLFTPESLLSIWSTQNVLNRDQHTRFTHNLVDNNLSRLLGPNSTPSHLLTAGNHFKNLSDEDWQEMISWASRVTHRHRMKVSVSHLTGAMRDLSRYSEDPDQGRLEDLRRLSSTFESRLQSRSIGQRVFDLRECVYAWTIEK